MYLKLMNNQRQHHVQVTVNDSFGKLGEQNG